MSEIQELMGEISAFADARNWDQFHTPKNLAMALVGEAGELVAEFQWLKPEESSLVSLSKEKLRDIELEIADVTIYLLRLADKLDVDIAGVVRDKIKINEKRFPTI
ncbi:MazG Predicted pyrophosphatase [Candidatus Nanopelagicaceae bacterium]